MEAESPIRRVEQPKPTQIMEKSLGILGLAVIFILVLIFFVIKPLIPKLKDQNIQIKTTKQEYNEKKEKVENYPALKAEMEKNQTEIKKLSLGLPAEKDIPELLMQLQTISQNSQLPISAISPTAKEFVQRQATTNQEGEVESANQTQSSAQPTVLPLTVNLTFKESGFNTFLSFLQNLENNLRVIAVKSFNLSANESGRITANMIFETYYQGQGQETGGAKNEKR